MSSLYLTYLTQLGITTPVRDAALLLQAMTHKSYAADLNPSPPHQERLEFLGDSIVGMAVAESLYRSMPDVDESLLTLYKIALVQQKSLAAVARHIQLDQQLLLSNGEEKKWGRNNDAILCDGLESLIGYLYIDHGWEVAQQFVQRAIIDVMLPDMNHLTIRSFKSLIQERSQWQYKMLPTYIDTEIIKEDKTNTILYESQLRIHEKHHATATGTSKKKAQEQAAMIAYGQIDVK